MNKFSTNELHDKITLFQTASNRFDIYTENALFQTASNRFNIHKVNIIVSKCGLIFTEV